MKLYDLFFRVIIALILLSILSFFNNITKSIIEFIENTLTITSTRKNENIITLVIYLIIGTISLIIIIKDNQYFSENYDVSLIRKFTASIFRLIGFVSIFFILFSIYLLM